MRNVIAIFLGFISDFIFSIILFFIVTNIENSYFIYIKRYSKEQILDILKSSNFQNINSLIFGFFCIFLGGIVCSLISKKNIVINTIFLGILFLISDIIFFQFSLNDNQICFNIISLLLIIPITVLAGICVKLIKSHWLH